MLEYKKARKAKKKLISRRPNSAFSAISSQKS